MKVKFSKFTFSLGDKGIKSPKGAIFLREQVLKFFDEKIKGVIFSKSNIFYTIRNLSKCKCLKQSCIFDLKLWAKSYDQKK